MAEAEFTPVAETPSINEKKRMASRKAAKNPATPEKASKLSDNLKKAQAVRAAKMAARRAVEEKVRLNMPITEQERDLLNWRGGKVARTQQTKSIMAAAAQLMIKSKSVNELRLLVETTAAKLNYNPIEALILMTQPSAGPNGEIIPAKLDPKDAAGVHKALLPFLVPQLATPKPEPANADKREIKVTITNFVLPAKSVSPLHTQAPAVVTVEQDPSNRIPPILRD